MGLVVICAWCGRMTGWKNEAAGEPDTSRVSHTICHECKERVIQELHTARQNRSEA